MKTQTLLCTAALLAAPAAFGQEFKLQLVPEGASPKYLTYYMPTFIPLSAKPPEGVKRAPGGLRAPLYGALKLGDTNAPATTLVIVDEPDSGEAKLYVDTNGNGDFTDDPPANWAGREVKRRDGSPGTQYSGDSMVGLRYGGPLLTVRYKFYRFDKNDPARKTQASNLYYYRDYIRAGDITLGEKKYAATLSDDRNRGDFRAAPGGTGGVTLLVDANGDGKFDTATERFPVGQPFNIGGKNYIAEVPVASGETLRISPSAVAAVERKPRPESKTPGVGAQVLAFTAKTTSGGTVDFPAGFKGKLVMLDFWATWCPPCVAEAPNLAAAYNKYHAQGFEVLGISLDDSSKSPAEVQSFAASKGMKWAHISEGGKWDTRLAILYDVHSIPKALLVDGDTGKVLADDGLRGSTLAPAIEKALADKKKGK
ncbi:MAG: TlpA family protein disulfide reductase [Verrucomicrobia bacterium]|nr:TlpA family protein disulfide reductase [Verrucomicrobiota bacterium]